MFLPQISLINFLKYMSISWANVSMFLSFKFLQKDNKLSLSSNNFSGKFSHKYLNSSSFLLYL